MTTPPPFAERLLRAAVRDPEWRDAITGDLREELASLAARRGAAVARRWYWRQAVPLALRFVVGRVVPSATPSRQRVSIRDVEAASTLGAGWSRELRHAWRGVTQRPGLSAVIVTTLALALTANAVVFTLGDALYLRPFRFPDVDRLLLVSSDTNAGALYLDRESVTLPRAGEVVRSLRGLTVEGVPAFPVLTVTLPSDVPLAGARFSVSASVTSGSALTPQLRAEGAYVAHGKSAPMLKPFGPGPVAVIATVYTPGVL